MFNITNNKGFHMTFANGWTVSVQWGGGNYSNNYSSGIITGEVPASKTAEIAAWKGDVWHNFDNGQTVNGYVSADDVAKFIAIIANKN